MNSSSLENDASKIDKSEQETALESHGEPKLDINSNTTNLPEDTKWEKIRFLGCCPLARLIPTYRTYCRYWEIDCLMPPFVTLIILFNVLVYSLIVLPKLSLTGLISSCVFVYIFFILFMISYFMAMCMDPGYLPYDWIVRQKTKYTPDELYPGIALRKEQFNFAENNRCPYASFSKSSGLFVVRGDHICGWVTNWIGKRNHKQFILMLLYGSLYCLSSFITMFFVPNFFHLKKSNLIPLIISSILNYLHFVQHYHLQPMVKHKYQFIKKLKLRKSQL